MMAFGKKHKTDEPNIEEFNMTDEQIDEINAEVNAEQLEEGMVISRDTESEKKPLSPEEAAEKEMRDEEDMWVKSKDYTQYQDDSPAAEEYTAETEADEYEQTMVDSPDKNNHVVDENDDRG